MYLIYNFITYYDTLRVSAFFDLTNITRQKQNLRYLIYN